MAEEINGEKSASEFGGREAEGGKEAPAPDGNREVVGHEYRTEWVICPRCGYRRCIDVDTEYIQWFTCGNCGVTITPEGEMR